LRATQAAEQGTDGRRGGLEEEAVEQPMLRMAWTISIFTQRILENNCQKYKVNHD
jgi:hypothetical protein